MARIRWAKLLNDKVRFVIFLQSLFIFNCCAITSAVELIPMPAKVIPVRADKPIALHFRMQLDGSKTKYYLNQVDTFFY